MICLFQQKKRDARVATLFAYRQIQLRLNRNEELHIKLDEKLLELQRVETKTPDPVVLEETADLACRILRREWEATKWGPFVRLIRYWRGHSGLIASRRVYQLQYCPCIRRFAFLRQHGASSAIPHRL